MYAYNFLSVSSKYYSEYWQRYASNNFTCTSIPRHIDAKKEGKKADAQDIASDLFLDDVVTYFFSTYDRFTVIWIEEHGVFLTSFDDDDLHYELLRLSSLFIILVRYGYQPTLSY